MKKRFLIIISISGMLHSMYLWESRRDQSASCCLYVNGVGDICNPFVPCTRNVHVDLIGIFDYITRIMVADKQFSDKGITFSYVKLLNKAQETIAYLLSTPVQLFYRFDTAQRGIVFLHDMVNQVRTVEKTGKNNAGGLAHNAGTEKIKNEEVVLAYMVKLGLARPLK